MAVDVDERAHAAVVVEALDGPLGQWQAFDVDELPADLPPIYVEVYVSRRFGAPLRPCGARQGSAWRLRTRAVGRTVDEARAARHAVAGRLDDQRLVIGGVETKPVRFEAEDPIGWDDGRYSGSTTWTYWL